MLFAEVSMVHISFAGCCRMQVSHSAGCCRMRALPPAGCRRMQRKILPDAVRSLRLSWCSRPCSLGPSFLMYTHPRPLLIGLWAFALALPTVHCGATDPLLADLVLALDLVLTLLV